MTETGSDAAPRGRSSPLPQEEPSPGRAAQPAGDPHPFGRSPGTTAPSRSPLAELGLPVRPAGSRPSGTRSALRPAPPPGPLAEARSPRSRHGFSQRGELPRPRALPLGTAAGGERGREGGKPFAPLPASSNGGGWSGPKQNKPPYGQQPARQLGLPACPALIGRTCASHSANRRAPLWRERVTSSLPMGAGRRGRRRGARWPRPSPACPSLLAAVSTARGAVRESLPRGSTAPDGRAQVKHGSEPFQRASTSTEI